MGGSRETLQWSAPDSGGFPFSVSVFKMNIRELTSHLFVTLQVVSPTISSPVCQEQLIEAGKLVDRSVESCVQACLSATEDGELLKQVSKQLESAQGSAFSCTACLKFVSGVYNINWQRAVQPCVGGNEERIMSPLCLRGKKCRA